MGGKIAPHADNRDLDRLASSSLFIFVNVGLRVFIDDGAFEPTLS
jgi:hypothetical protein